MSTPANLQLWHWQFATPITGAAHEAWTLVGSEDTSYEGALDTDYAIILKIGNTGEMADNDDYQLQYDINGADTWNDVNATSSFVRSAASGDTDDATSTTQRLTAISGTTYDLSNLDEGDGLQTQNVGGLDSHEFYFTFNTRSAELSGGDSITFRLVATSGPTPVPEDTSLGTTPTMTIPQQVPILTLPTEANISQTSATVGCTTDTATGTLYWFVSTSATPPTAANLKAGVGAAHSSAYGNVSSPGVGIETFFVDGLTPDTTYYTYFIHNDTPGDSSILESGSWSTNPIETASETFTVNTDQTQDNSKITSENVNYSNQLSETSSGNFIISGSSTFGISLAYTIAADLTIPVEFSVTLDSAEEFNTVIAGINTFSFTLDLDNDIEGVGILDNPIYSAGNYIFVDLTNVLAASTGIVSGSITFINDLGIQESIRLVGSAAEQLVINLAQSQIATRVTEESETFTTLQDLGLKTAEFVTFIANIDTSILSTNQVDGLKSIFYNLALSKDSVNSKVTSDSLVLTGDFDTNFVVNLLANTTVAFDTQVSFENSIQSDLNTALDFLSSLDFTFDGDTALAGNVSFDLSLLKTQEVEQILSSTITLINLLSDNYQKSIITSQAIDFISNLEQQQAGDTAILEALQFTLQAQQVQTNNLTAGKAISIILELAEDANVQINFSETLNLLTQLSKVPTANKSLLENISFNTEVSQAQELLLNKLATIAFDNTLNYLQEVQADLGAILDFATLAATLYTGEVTGSWEGYVTFQSQLNKAITTQTTYNPIIDLNSSLQTIHSATKGTSASVSIDIELAQAQTKLLDKAISLAFDATFTELQTNTVDFYVFANLISSFNDLYSGDLESAITGLIEFNILAQQDQVNLAIGNKNIDFNALMFESSIGSILNKILGSVVFDVQFTDQPEVSVDLNDFVSFNTYLDKTELTNIDYMPSINFDFQTLLASTNNKNALASILLDLDNAVSATGTTGISAFISYALQQNYITDIKLTVEGTAELTTELAESKTLQQILGTDIQFGHLLGLSAISRADFADLISFGTITGISTTGRVLELEIRLPDDRKCKVYFEDRLVITYPDE